MKLIEQLEEQIQNEISQAKVTQEAFDLWQSNEVTRLLMSRIKESYLEALIMQPIGTSEQVFSMQIQRKSVCDTLELLLEWNPIKDLNE